MRRKSKRAKKPRLLVDLTCADPTVAFHGEWSSPEEPEEILACAREKAMASGLPVQIEIHGHGVWSIAPTGKVISGRLFRREKLPVLGQSRQKSRD